MIQIKTGKNNFPGYNSYRDVYIYNIYLMNNNILYKYNKL